MKTTKKKIVSIIMTFVLVILSMNYIQIQASAATSLSAKQKQLCKTLAKYQNNYLKNPSSFKIKKIYQGTYE